MNHWTIVLLAGIVPGAVIFLLPAFFFCWWRPRHRVSAAAGTRLADLENASRAEKLEAGLTKFHLQGNKEILKFRHLHQHHHHQAADNHQLAFDWDDNPRLITEVAENGWSSFAFDGRSQLPVLRSTPSRWGLCTACDEGEWQQPEAEINWEVPTGASEFMQTVRLNPGLNNGSDSPCFSIKMSLPLPGPQLPTCSFPREAYFEITVLHLQPLQQQQRSHRTSKRSRGKSVSEGDRIKLIEESSIEVNSDQINIKRSGIIDFASPITETKPDKEEEGRYNNVMISFGLAINGQFSSRSMPGTYPGSLGFHSNGSVFLDGIKLVYESDRTEWTGVNRVVGCGFNPRKKMVFLTVDSELVHIIRCNSDAYQGPLFPVLAANAEVMMLVNLGQSAFKYSPANAQRTPNPCFARASPDVAITMSSSCEDSRELFSMGRPESDWYDIMTRSKNQSSSKKSRGDDNADAESDLFEITLQN